MKKNLVIGIALVMSVLMISGVYAGWFGITGKATAPVTSVTTKIFSLTTGGSQYEFTINNIKYRVYNLQTTNEGATFSFKVGRVVGAGIVASYPVTGAKPGSSFNIPSNVGPLKVRVTSYSYLRFQKKFRVSFNVQNYFLCGNDILEGTEQCDRTNLGAFDGMDCKGYNSRYASGELSCNHNSIRANCRIDLSECQEATPTDECVSNSDCNSGYVCSNGVCVLSTTGEVTYQGVLDMLKRCELRLAGPSGDDSTKWATCTQTCENLAYGSLKTCIAGGVKRSLATSTLTPNACDMVYRRSTYENVYCICCSP